MKNLNLIINAVLGIAVAVLFFLHFKNHSKNSTPKVAAAANADGKVVSTPIAYVDIDSLQAHLDYFQAKKKELEARQKSIESTFARDEQNFQKEYNEAIQKAQSVTSQEEYAALEARIQKKGMEIQQRKETMTTSFMNEQDKFSEEINSKLDSFIQEYNKDEKFSYIFSYKKIGLILYKPKAMDITNEVVAGMNEKFPVKK